MLAALLVAGLTIVAAVTFGCSSEERVAVGRLSKAEGGVEREHGGAFRPLEIGAKVFRGDRLRTSAAAAEVQLLDGTTLAIMPRSEVRLVDRGGTLGFEVGRGALVIEGSGTFALEIGQVRLDRGSIRVAAREGRNDDTLELVVGRAELLEASGKRWALEVGTIVTLEIGTIVLETIDAGVPDAAVAPATDAGAGAATTDLATIDITGDGASVEIGGRSRRLSPGRSELAAGARLVVDDKTRAVVALGETTLELVGARMVATADSELVIERGVATARLGGTGAVQLPGGRMVGTGTATAPAELRIEVDRRGNATVVAVLAGAKLIGKRGTSSIELRRGDRGVVSAGGTVAAADTEIPDHHDLEVVAGKPAAMTLHDPAGVTAVRFDFAGACPTGGVVELDRDAAFRLPRVSFGEGGANLLVRTGRWVYRLRCVVGGALGPAVSTGKLAVRRDGGTRPLPKAPPRYSIDADGRNYRLSYQTQIPNVQVRASGRGRAFTLHLVSGASKHRFESATNSIDIPASVLREREYTFWVERDGQKSRVSTLKIAFDQTAAHVYIEAPVEGRAWGAEIEIRGATLPGWTASIDGTTIPADKNTRRFRTTVATPRDARAIGIRLEHPQHGVHLYVRRGRLASTSP